MAARRGASRLATFCHSAPPPALRSQLRTRVLRMSYGSISVARSPVLQARRSVQSFHTALRFQKAPKDSSGFGNGGSGSGGRGGGGSWWGGGGGDGGDRGPLLRLLGLYSEALTNRPLLTKASTSLVLGLTGDYCAQGLEGRRELDVRRMLSVGAYCFVGLAPMLHTWYALLDRIVYSGRALLLRKLLLDQLMFAPVANSCFIFGVGAFEGKHVDELVENVRSKFWPSMQANWILWPGAQAINFSVVTPNYRVLFSNCVGFVWNIILTYLAHKEHDK